MSKTNSELRLDKAGQQASKLFGRRVALPSGPPFEDDLAVVIDVPDAAWIEGKAS